ncbi:MAG: trypsin-like peptidase domain-containing protein [Chitinophagaceae bacterium]
MKNRFTIAFAGIALSAFALGWAWHATGQKNYNSILQDNTSMPVVKTVYSSGTPAAAPVDFEKAASSVPSVVHIKTVTKFSQVKGRGRQQQQQNPFGDMFGGDDVFRRFFGDGNGQAYSQPDQKASGSGVIISNDGYIVTNNHVVDGATEISVTLNDRKTYKAKVIGTDPNTDLALIKIEGKDLPVMNVGNSDDVKLGQWVMAIGYPLNLDVTVTQGIVSAKSRNIGINRQSASPVESFIQTDAAVNPGSSGGALVNLNGDLIGITSAIASPTGAYAGYAYSIPSNLVKKVIGDIMKFGSVQRGYLGISMAPEDMDDAQKKELGINDDVNGVWVAETDPNGAAAEAGIKKGDAITKLNGVPVATSAQLSEQVARMKPGDKLQLTVLRGTTEKTVSVTLKNKLGTFDSQKQAVIASLGAEFATLGKTDAAKLNLAGGVVVGDIKDGIIADQTNMKTGFVITKVNGIAVNSLEEFKDVMSKQSGNLQIEGRYPGSKETYYYGINDFNK